MHHGLRTLAAHLLLGFDRRRGADPFPFYRVELTVGVTVKARQQTRIIGFPIADDPPRQRLRRPGITAAAAAFEPAQGVELIVLLQPLLGIAVTAPEQTEHTRRSPLAQGATLIALPAAPPPGMNLRGAGLDPATAGIVTQQEGSVRAAALDRAPFRVAPPTL